MSADRSTHSRQHESDDIDAQIKLAELEIKKAEVAKIRVEIGRSPVNWTVFGPLLAAIAVAVIGLVSTIYVASVNGKNQTELESIKANTTLIIEAVKTGSQDPAVAQRNLQFFLDAGLLTDPSGRIARFVKQGTQPVLAVTGAAPAFEITIFSSFNIGGINQRSEGPPQRTTFTVFNDHYVSFVATYHWNNGQGKPGGEIILKQSDGKEIGRWSVITSSGQGNAPNVNWICRPNIKIPAGTYEIVDSDKASWSYNNQSQGMGFTRVLGYPTL